MTETALLLTQEEWDDLEHMVTHYREATSWVEAGNAQTRSSDAHLAQITRRRDLAERIAEANS